MPPSWLCAPPGWEARCRGDPNRGLPVPSRADNRIDTGSQTSGVVHPIRFRQGAGVSRCLSAPAARAKEAPSEMAPWASAQVYPKRRSGAGAPAQCLSARLRQATDHQVVRVLDHVLDQLISERPIDDHGVPVTRVQVVARKHRGVRPAELLSVSAVLAPIGLRLSAEKSGICHIDKGFDSWSGASSAGPGAVEATSGRSTPTHRRRPWPR